MAENISVTASMKVSAALKAQTSFVDAKGNNDHCQWIRMKAPRCNSFTPLGRPVLPVIYF
jgi:hypothetical protein